MNSYPLTTLWLQILALIAVEVGVVALAFVAFQRRCRSAVWRRTLCQGALITSLVLGFSELSGAGWSLVARLFWPKPFAGNVTGNLVSVHRAGVETPPNQLQLDPEFRSSVMSRLVKTQPQVSDPVVEDSSSASRAIAPDSPVFSHELAIANHQLPITDYHSAVTDSTATLWLGMIVGIGAAFIAGRACLGRLILIFLGARRRAIAESELLCRVHSLARNLNISRRVRIIESPRLVSPIAFGLIRPTIGLPLNFCQRFSTEKQEIMLTHELAHLAAHDPFWYLIADLVVAIFWWHPGIWWLRRQLQLSSELAADEASLLKTDGPRVLAECLVEMGAQLAKPALGQLRVAGFRSDLGCRVQRLMRLEGGRWTPISRGRAVLAKSIGPIAVATTVIFCTAWAVPRELTKGDSMKNMKQNWQRALATIATLAAIQTPSVIVGQENAAPPAAPAPAVGIAANVAPPTAESGATPNALPVAQNQPDPDPQFARRYGLAGVPRPYAPEAAAANPFNPSGQPGNPPQGGRLEAKLREIVLDEVKFEGLPLGEVLMFLGEESHKHDPEKKGINFLINPNPPQNQVSVPGQIDPTTGLPVPSVGMESIDMNSVIVKFNMPLRHVTMADVLDAIVRVADHPVQYSVEDYAVIFSLRADANAMQPMAGRFNPGPAPLAVRTFHVDTNTFVAGLESAFGIKVETKGKETPSRKIQSALRELLVQLNVTMEGNKAIFYNELTGTVMVRVVADDLDVITAAIETLGGQAMGNYAMGYSPMIPPSAMRR